MQKRKGKSTEQISYIFIYSYWRCVYAGRWWIFDYILFWRSMRCVRCANAQSSWVFADFFLVSVDKVNGRAIDWLIVVVGAAVRLVSTRGEGSAGHKCAKSQFPWKKSGSNKIDDLPPSTAETRKYYYVHDFVINSIWFVSHFGHSVSHCARRLKKIIENGPCQSHGKCLDAVRRYEYFECIFIPSIWMQVEDERSNRNGMQSTTVEMTWPA